MTVDHHDGDWTSDSPSTRFSLAEAQAAWLTDATRGKERERHIREAAYFKAERRGFAPGHELDDWLAAEAEIDAQRSREMD
jgi:hypothetical protein